MKVRMEKKEKKKRRKKEEGFSVLQFLKQRPI